MPSPCAPSSNIGVETKGGGEALLVRKNRLAFTPVEVSLAIRAVTLTDSVERGTRGKCWTSMISGAMLEDRTEFTAPGVPFTDRLALQFWPQSLRTVGFTSSRDFPSPSCSADQIQPRNPLFNGPLCRTAQSPSSE